jgi:hypothetical protein
LLGIPRNAHPPAAHLYYGALAGRFARRRPFSLRGEGSGCRKRFSNGPCGLWPLSAHELALRDGGGALATEHAYYRIIHRTADNRTMECPVRDSGPDVLGGCRAEQA